MMDEIHISAAKHAIGLDYKKPYTRNGKKFYKLYRNNFGTLLNDAIWTVLAEVGYAAHDEPIEDMVMYWLTEKGLKWLGNELGIKIYEEMR